MRTGAAVLRHACTMDGIVAKRRDRPYRSGRSPDWVKVKNPDDAGGDKDDRKVTAALP